MRRQAAWLVAALAASGFAFAQTGEGGAKSDAERTGALCANQGDAAAHGHGMRERRGGGGRAGSDGTPGAPGHGEGCPMHLAGDSSALGKPQGGTACGGAAGGKGEAAPQRGRGMGMHGQGMHGQGMHGGGAEIAPALATPAPK